MVQCIQITQHEYAEAFGGDGWRKTISSSVNSNSDYINPPQPEQQPSASQPIVHPEAGRPDPQPAPAPPPPPSPCSAGFTPASSSLPSSTPAPQSAATAPSSTRGSTSAIQSSTSAQRSNQQAPQPSPHVASTPSATRQNPAAPASTPRTGPSGAPVLAPLPPKPGVPPGSRSS
jgi:hypothetical protein